MLRRKAYTYLADCLFLKSLLKALVMEKKSMVCLI